MIAEGTSATAVADRASPRSARGLAGRRGVGALRGATTFAVVLACWFGATSSKLVNPVLLPSPVDVVNTAVEMLRSGELANSVIVSLARILAGFALGFVTALPAGMLIGRVRIVRDFMEPILDTIRPIPALAFLPLAILWFGIGEESKLFLLWFGTFFVLIISVIEGVYNVDNNLVLAAQNLEANALQLYRYVLLPAMVPFVLEGVRQASATAFRVVVSAEMIAAQAGIGYLILQSSLFYRSDRVFVGIISLGVLGMLTDRLLAALARRYYMRYRSADGEW